MTEIVVYCDDSSHARWDVVVFGDKGTRGAPTGCNWRPLLAGEDGNRGLALEPDLWPRLDLVEESVHWKGLGDTHNKVVTIGTMSSRYNLRCTKCDSAPVPVRAVKLEPLLVRIAEAGLSDLSLRTIAAYLADT